MVGLANLIYAGDHGFDISGPGETRIHHEVGADLVPDVARAAGELRRRLTDVPGVLVEEKRFTVAVHYRLVAQEGVGRVEREVDTVLESYPHLESARGKKVLEVKPRLEWDKGKAVLWLLTALGLDGPEVLPIYLGDDRTDEDAFAALRGRGLGILVTTTPRPTRADYSLQDPDEVCAFLARLAASLDSRSTA
jgi:alpha,alpha-trehalase